MEYVTTYQRCEKRLERQKIFQIFNVCFVEENVEEKL